MQAEEQVRLAKERKKGDKIVSDSQERAYWRVYRPPPGFTSSLEPVPATKAKEQKLRRRTEELKREVKYSLLPILGCHALAGIPELLAFPVLLTNHTVHSSKSMSCTGKRFSLS